MRKLIIALTIFVLAAAGALISFRKMSQLRSEAGWLLVRADAHAADYASSLDGAFAETELMTFDQRRTLLERAQRWQQLEMFCVLVGVAAAILGYSFYVMRRVRDEVIRDEMAPR